MKDVHKNDDVIQPEELIERLDVLFRMGMSINPEFANYAGGKEFINEKLKKKQIKLAAGMYVPVVPVEFSIEWSDKKVASY